MHYNVSENFLWNKPFGIKFGFISYTQSELLFPPEAHCFNTDITIKVAGLIKVGCKMDAVTLHGIVHYYWESRDIKITWACQT